MGTINTACRIENLRERSRSIGIPRLLVDTGSASTWILRSTLECIGVTEVKKQRSFAMADGRTITRPVGFVVIRVGADVTTDEAVFAEPGELQLLGARTLEGLRLRVDPVHKMLIPTGPAPAAHACA